MEVLDGIQVLNSFALLVQNYKYLHLSVGRDSAAVCGYARRARAAAAGVYFSLPAY